MERTKDEDARRFASHKITFDFSCVDGVKEASVKLSARILEACLQVSQAPARDQSWVHKRMIRIRTYSR